VPAENLEQLTAALADRYRIERELGAGGMATVYLAHDIRHDRKVALKVLKPELAAVIGATRFLTEIKTTANLQHPHILPLHDSGVVDGTVFYVMPLVQGESLRDRLTREKQLPIPDAIRITTAVADALQYAHSHNVIHRDIKPENILLQDGHALVTDFGIALATRSADSRMTETGMSLGTPHYMSPEQAMGERDIDARSDVYALGCVLYEMLTGQPPFTGPTAQSIVAKVITEQPAPPSRLRGTVGDDLNDTVLTALEKLPADRFPTAAAFASALNDGPPKQKLRRPAKRSTPTSSRRFIGAGVGALGVMLIAGWALTKNRATSTGPTTYDAALPDSAPMAFVSAAQSGYGLAGTNISIASDGSFAVFAAEKGDNTILYWRSLRDSQGRPIPGTEGAEAPKISPDGLRVAFFSNRRVMVAPVSGAAGRHVADTRGNVWAEGDDQPPGGLHGWSDTPYRPADPDAMREAPARLGTGYPGEGHEISAYGYPDGDSALAAWQRSAGHDALLAERGGWADPGFAAIGVGLQTAPGPGIYAGRVFHVWFGEVADPTGAPTIRGTGEGERIAGTRFADSVAAGGGDDRLLGGAGHDRLFGQAGNDRLVAGPGRDFLKGGRSEGGR
jgi:serine/threonine-protein kinase